MPAAVIPNAGENELLRGALGGQTFLRLFMNDAPVLPGSVLADFTPALFPGYADQDVSLLWTVPTIDDVGRSYSRLSNITWTRGAGGVVETDYGWILYRNPTPTSVILCGQRFSVPYITSAPGQVIVFSIIAYLLRG